MTSGIVDGLLNMYGPDGYTVVSLNLSDGKYQNEEWTFQNILIWGACSSTSWNGNEKTFYDPSPQGWRVPSYGVFLTFFKDNNYKGNYTTNKGSNAHSALNGSDETAIMQDGGALIQYGKNSTEVTYIRLTGYRRTATSFEGINGFTALWGRDNINGDQAWAFVINGKTLGDLFITELSSKWTRTDAHQVRCIQEMP